MLPRTIVEHRAAKIADPIARLRYLRGHSVKEGGLLAPTRKSRKLPAAGLALLLTALMIPGYKASNGKETPPPALIVKQPPARAEVLTNVWLVDKTKDYETYSNGLRIDNRYAVSNEPRLFYPVYQPGSLSASSPEWHSEPAGIVYHTTESDQAVFEAGQTRELKRIGKQVLLFVQRNHSYHFVIDRFGEVFRVVQESDLANHAGNSVWADQSGVYVSLNGSFLGIAFETQTQRAQDLPSANEAQIHSARVLTEMLRWKYRIAAANCVTHAQVSVNPDNMLIGYHTDWAGNFPFSELGLRDNYAAPPPSIYTFGFNYDPAFLQSTGARVWQGLALADDRLRIEAKARGLSTRQYRLVLQKKFKDILETLKASSALKEKDNET